MDFSTILFGKPLNQLAYGDIEQFFAEEREESIHAEFKSFSTKHGNFQKNLEGVIRGICGFLNSEGGVLVWGAPEEDRTSEKEFEGKLSPLTEKMEKDWLINKVSDSISPLPTGVNVEILESDGRFVYVFEVQVSNYSPHQYKNTYWARIDGQTKPAPHYLVEALFRKVRYPNIECYMTIDYIFQKDWRVIISSTLWLFNFSKLQNEENIHLSILSPYGQILRSEEGSSLDEYQDGGHRIMMRNFVDILHFGGPVAHQEQIAFDYVSMKEKDDYKAEILISFGGKQSPLKTSLYKLDFRNFITGKGVANLNELIEEKNENILVSDQEEELGTTKENLLKEVLGR